MENIKVSVIVPSYKRTKDLFSRAIQSLLNQTYQNIEIVVVDDNAKPEHIEYRQALESYIQELHSEKILYIQNKENLGGALARNEGIKQATGEYITFLDDDDRYLPNKIKNQLEFIIENNLEMSFGDVALYNEKEVMFDYRSHHDIKNFDTDYLMKYHLTKQITGTPSFMVKKDILLNIGMFEPAVMGQEYYLMFKIIKSGCKIGYYPNCDFVAYRTNAEAISTGKNKIPGENALYTFKKDNFKLLNCWQRSYVRCRHYAVLAVANKRNKHYFKMLGNLIVSVCCNPLIVISEAFGFVGRLFKGKKNK